MNRFTCCMATLALVLIPAGSALAEKTDEAAPKPLKPKEALRILAAGQGEQLQQAVQTLRKAKDLLTKHAKPLAGIVEAAPGDPDVAGQVLDLVHDRGDKGCAFIASLLTKKNTAWVRAVLQRFTLLPRCPAFSEAIADVLRWVPDPDSSSQAAHLVTQVFSIVQEGGIKGLDESVCRFVRRGSEGFRRSAIRTILTVRPPWGDACLIQAYMDEQRAGKPSRTVRQDMLRAISEFSGVDSVPTLILSLNHEEDRNLACDLLCGAGEAGAAGLIFALRTSNAGMEAVNECLARVGEPAVAGILPLLDHHSPKIREFALQFLSRFRTLRALHILRERFDAGGRGIDRARLLMLLSRYPVAQMKAVLEGALGDAEESIRIMALNAIESSQATEFTEALLRTTEGDRSARVRKRALKVVFHLGVEGGEVLALRMAQYDRPEVAIEAIRILGYMKDRVAYDVLMTLLKSVQPTVVAAAREALWLQTFEDPKKDPSYKPPTDAGTPKDTRAVECDGGQAAVLGDEGPLIVVLPGGPGMDFSWAVPYLDELSDEATVAFLEPSFEEVDEDSSEFRLVEPGTLVSLLEKLEHETCVLVSMGLGGTAALWLSTLEADKVDGVAVISSALPGHLQGMDDALVSRLDEPFKSMVGPLIENQGLFRKEALSRYLARNLAPAMVGEDDGDPWDYLGLTWDVSRTGQTFSVLSRPEVRFVPTEFPGKILMILPSEWLPEAYLKWYEDARSMAPDRFEIEDMTDCGFMPQIPCRSKIVDLLWDFTDEASRKEER